MGISPHCEKIIEEPITKELCYDFRKIRARVMCLAWKYMSEKHIPFGTAISKAWDTAKTECSAIGAHI